MRVPSERDPVTPRPVELSKLLLVEGETPSHFFEALARDQGLEKQIEIRSFGGNDELPTFLRTLAAGRDFRENVRSLGIIRDAEKDPVAAKNSVNSAIKNSNIRSGVKVRVAILPDDATAGMLETLLVASVDQSEVFQCVEAFFECLKSDGNSPLDGIKAAKYLAQVYMAAFEKGVQRAPGPASYSGVWPFESEVFDGLKAFLREL